jgi:hypothetical protein
VSIGGKPPLQCPLAEKLEERYLVELADTKSPGRSPSSYRGRSTNFSTAGSVGSARRHRISSAIRHTCQNGVPKTVGGRVEDNFGSSGGRCRAWRLRTLRLVIGLGLVHLMGPLEKTTTKLLGVVLRLGREAPQGMDSPAGPVKPCLACGRPCISWRRHA